MDAGDGDGGPADTAPAGFARAKRIGLAGATAFLAINVWTGAPLIALWVGARVVGKQTLSMTAVFVVVVVFGVLVLSIAFALAWLDARYNRLTGRRLRENRLTWLRSMNTQGETVNDGAGTSLLEAIVMGSVYLGVAGFLVWFFAFAGSPLGN